MEGAQRNEAEREREGEREREKKCLYMLKNM